MIQNGKPALFPSHTLSDGWKGSRQIKNIVTAIVSNACCAIISPIVDTVMLLLAQKDFITEMSLRELIYQNSLTTYRVGCRGHLVRRLIAPALLLDRKDNLMLYDLKWDTRSLESFINWLEQKPREAKYDFCHPDKCAIAQWLQEKGDPEYSIACVEPLFAGNGEYVAQGNGDIRCWTFGAALERAREVAQMKKAPAR